MEKIKFYDEVTKKCYDSMEEAEKAQADALENQKKQEEEKARLIAERKARADEVEQAKQAMKEAQDNYKKLLSDFLRDYKTYHYSVSSIEGVPSIIWDWFSKF